MASLACEPTVGLPPDRLVPARCARLVRVACGSGLSMCRPTSVGPLSLAGSGRGGTGAGLSTGAMMSAAVAGELVVPATLRRLGYRTTLAIGLVLLGVPSVLRI